jgi:general secretion pathway protein D
MLRNNFLFILILLFISACSSVSKTVPLKFPEPLREPITDTVGMVPVQLPVEETESEKQPSTKPRQTQFEDVPAMPHYQSRQTGSGTQVDNTPNLQGPPVQINVDGLPLPAFINEVYGNVLSLSFEIDKDLQRKKDLVTLRVSEPQKPKELYKLAAQVLDNYGVGIEQQGKLLRFLPAKSVSAGEPPLLVQGTALPSVPASHRPVFQFIPLKVVQNAMVRRWIKDAYQGQQIEVSEDMTRNAIILRGKPEIVAQAAEAVRILDQPLMRGRYSTLIEPAFISVQELTQRLTSVLEAQGYRVGGSAPIIFVPFPSNNSLLVFSADKAVLNHVKAWAMKLDNALTQEDPGPKQRVYYYSAKNTTAKSLNEVLSQLLSGVLATKTTANNQPPTSQLSSKLVVDETRNILIFYGESEVWSQMLQVLRKLDTPAKQVLIEVTIAEISLSDDTKFGIEWTLREAGIGSGRDEIATSGLGLGGTGLTFKALNSSGLTRAVLNAFSTSSQVKVLSTPTIMVRSGESADIQVGRDVPIITSQATGQGVQANQGETAILQSVQYRETGVSLSVKPVVYSESQVDLEISQSSSEAQINNLSTVQSPIISNRSIKTSLSLSDGGSVLLGGLISNNETIGETGIPLLKDIPILGHLFRADSATTERSELVMLIIPYVLNNTQQAMDVTNAFKDKLSIIQPSSEIISDIPPEQPILEPVNQ